MLLRQGNDLFRLELNNVEQQMFFSPIVVKQEMFAEVVCRIIKPVEVEDVKTQILTSEWANHSPRCSRHHAMRS